MRDCFLSRIEIRNEIKKTVQSGFDLHVCDKLKIKDKHTKVHGRQTSRYIWYLIMDYIIGI